MGCRIRERKDPPVDRSVALMTGVLAGREVAFVRRTETAVSDRSAPANAPADGRRLTYLPGVDGLRAVAVLAVLLYHADLTWIRGGFLGVDVFFVISGYLITTLLLTEWLQRGRIDLPAFWFRRARRLLPALFLLMAVVLVFAVLFLSTEVAGLRGDALAAFSYVTNWYLIFSDQSYFEMMGRPSLFTGTFGRGVEDSSISFGPCPCRHDVAAATAPRPVGRTCRSGGVAVLWPPLLAGRRPSRFTTAPIPEA
jgi:hypothetical protein